MHEDEQEIHFNIQTVKGTKTLDYNERNQLAQMLKKAREQQEDHLADLADIAQD
jgi:hypothetical protein